MPAYKKYSETLTLHTQAMGIIIDEEKGGTLGQRLDKTTSLLREKLPEAQVSSRGIKWISDVVKREGHHLEQVS